MKELFRQTVYWGHALISVEFSQIKMFNLNLASKKKVVIHGLISHKKKYLHICLLNSNNKFNVYVVGMTCFNLKHFDLRYFFMSF